MQIITKTFIHQIIVFNVLLKYVKLFFNKTSNWYITWESTFKSIEYKGTLRFVIVTNERYQIVNQHISVDGTGYKKEGQTQECCS